MLHPSYTELMEKINSDVDEGDTPIVQSRYSIVKATAARAKQIIDWRATSEKIDKRIAADPTGLEPQATKEEVYALSVGKPQLPESADLDERKPLSIAVDELYSGVVKIVDKREGK